MYSVEKVTKEEAETTKSLSGGQLKKKRENQDNIQESLEVRAIS